MNSASQFRPQPPVSLASEDWARDYNEIKALGGKVRIHSLNEEETEKLTFEEINAYWNIMHKIDPRSVRHAFEEAFIDRGLTNSDVLRLLERAEERAKWKQ